MNIANLGSLAKDTPEAEIAAFIDVVKHAPRKRKELLQYLPIQHAIYTGRSTNAVIRIRGYLLAAFAPTGLPDEALPYVLEVLESERSAYLVAAAAIALRGRRAPAPEFAPYLEKAFRNVKFVDDAISFDTWQPSWPVPNYTTALLEIVTTLQWMGSAALATASYLREQCEDVYVSEKVKVPLRAALQAMEQASGVKPDSCCRPLFTGSSSDRAFGRKQLPREVSELAMEDHAGEILEYGEYFSEMPAVVVLFYTRCDNPNKCSLTVTRLAQLQKQLADEGLAGRAKTAAITYDPVYDSSARIKTYCENRGVRLGATDRAFRIATGTPDLLRYLGSGVNYIGSIVNQHTIELFLLDDEGKIRGRFQQLQWQPAEVVSRLKALVGPKAALSGGPSAFASPLSPILSLLIAVSPKCPVCWAAYLSALGLTNIHLLGWTDWLVPLFVCLLLANLFSLARGVERNGWLPFVLSLAGTLCISSSLLARPNTVLNCMGMSLSVVGAVLNSLPKSTYRHLMRVFRWSRLQGENRSSSFLGGNKEPRGAEFFAN